jgi:16S rRNA A1518/A1519 N6-dimethyltransferase RsmA/KsgA/DIM1 with predicted DNA glycosylase/AP lyase activity
MLLIRHAVLHPGGLRHVNPGAQPGSKAGRQWFHNFRQYRILAGRQLPDSMRVLDLGAGTGKLTATLIALGAEVIAAEPDPAMLTELRRALS